MKIYFIKIILSTFLLCITIFGCRKDNPINPEDLVEISYISPDSGFVGDVVKITGRNFGNKLNSSFVMFNDIKAIDYLNWNDTNITVKVPNAVISGKVYISINQIKSNEVDFKLLNYDKIKSGICNVKGVIVNIHKWGSSYSSGKYYSWDDNYIDTITVNFYIKDCDSLTHVNVFKCDEGYMSNTSQPYEPPKIEWVRTYYMAGFLNFDTNSNKITNGKFEFLKGVVSFENINYTDNTIDLICLENITNIPDFKLQYSLSSYTRGGSYNFPSYSWETTNNIGFTDDATFELILHK